MTTDPHGQPDADHVQPGCECPTCGESNAGRLVWIDDDTVRCDSCGQEYRPPTERRQAVQGPALPGWTPTNWPAHFAGIEQEYRQIEKLANLDLIPRPHGFCVSCLPVKIKGASAGRCRAVALVPE